MLLISNTVVQNRYKIFIKISSMPVLINIFVRIKQSSILPLCLFFFLKLKPETTYPSSL